MIDSVTRNTCSYFYKDVSKFTKFPRKGVPLLYPRQKRCKNIIWRNELYILQKQRLFSSKTKAQVDHCTIFFSQSRKSLNYRQFFTNTFYIHPEREKEKRRARKILNRTKICAGVYCRFVSNVGTTIPRVEIAPPRGRIDNLSFSCSSQYSS